MTATTERTRDASTAEVKQRIFVATRNAIVGRKLPPGTKLTEDVIADTFGCGRGPVRWALARLGDEGLVTLVPHRGAFVAEPPLDEAKHLFGARRMLEGGIVRCLCGHRPPAGWRPLIACIEAEDRAHAEGDETAALRLSADFHLLMAELTGNPIVTTMLRELVSRTVLAITVHQRQGSSGCRTHEHRRLIALLEAGDVEGAAREMEDHLQALEAGLDLSPQPRSGTGLREVLQAALTMADD
ncbi:GntR family transcriptional regulator [Lichenihabitans sp. Uapishka_5]|uniref:GntR family transcriptional regulator n=1 Tax=Lichenihabitans sp. Uapishka_5 TaxID=3037302 RepID=UPI0029E81698|nr:GntR family transcriptional regulator [Lichenihabitans sp. Uapishka_5]MDX7950286.1 GntR family transcriptional regulator [Lichenihabitans sp. Uapishka_5]